LSMWKARIHLFSLKGCKNISSGQRPW